MGLNDSARAAAVSAAAAASRKEGLKPDNPRETSTPIEKWCGYSLNKTTEDRIAAWFKNAGISMNDAIVSPGQTVYLAMKVKEGTEWHSQNGSGVATDPSSLRVTFTLENYSYEMSLVGGIGRERSGSVSFSIWILAGTDSARRMPANSLIQIGQALETETNELAQ